MQVSTFLCNTYNTQTILLPQIIQTGAIDLYLITFIAFNPGRQVQVFLTRINCATKTQFSIRLIVRMPRGRFSRPNIFDVYALSISDPTRSRKLAKKIRRIPGPSISVCSLYQPIFQPRFTSTLIFDRE